METWAADLMEITDLIGAIDLMVILGLMETTDCLVAAGLMVAPCDPALTARFPAVETEAALMGAIIP